MSDDLATLQYRTVGRQKAPLIVRTRGHRLEGIWHSGSQLGGLVHLLRGIHILVPRNMTKAAGFYNTLLEGDDPALVIECLNGYRLTIKKVVSRFIRRFVRSNSVWISSPSTSSLPRYWLLWNEEETSHKLWIRSVLVLLNSNVWKEKSNRVLLVGGDWR